MRNKTIRSASVLTVASAALLLAASGASALEVKTGSDKVNVKLYGQIDRAVMYADDGDDSKFFHVDNNNSSTRVGLTGEVQASDSLTIGSNFEVEWLANSSDKVSMDEETISGEFKDRLVEIYLSCTRGGKLSLGKGKMASEDTSEVDLSGTDLAGMSGVYKVGGGVQFYDADAMAVPDEEADPRLAVGDVFTNMDGLGKKNRVRYDTISFAGFSIAAATGEESTNDVSLSYANDLPGGAKLKGAIAWADFGDSKDYSQINGSVSVLFPLGLNFTFASGVRDLDKMPAGGDDPTFMYGKVGYICPALFPAGSTALSVDYGVDENIKHQNTDEKGTTYGVQLVQKLSGWNTELYAAYRNYELEDNTTANYEDITIGMAGARLKF